MPDLTTALARRDVLEHVQRHDCAPTDGPVRVGVEQEWHTFRRTTPARHLDADDVLAVATGAGPLPLGSTVTVEPGGQVELATPPAAPWWEALDALRHDGAALRQRLAEAGIGTLASGIDPFRTPVRTLRRPRYDAMEAYFDRWGPAGRQMMCGSAAIQINVDHGDPATMARRWDLAHRIGPPLAAAFANSPDATHRSARLAVWSALDPSRTRPAFVTGDVADDWAAYVLGASLMLLHDGDDRCATVGTELTFGEWIESGLEGRRPTDDDLRYHCTTLFPPVRPRGWLELRWLDALPAGLAEVAVAAVVAVLTDDDAGAVAADACEGLSGSWADAAAHGAAHPALAAAATVTLRAAAEALDGSGAPGWCAEGVAAAAERWPARGCSPADDLEQRLRAGATSADLVDPPEEVLGWR